MIGNRMRSFSLLLVVLSLSTLYPGADSSGIETASSGAEVNRVLTRRDAGERFDSDAAARLAPTRADEELRNRFKLADRAEIEDLSTAALSDEPSVQWTQANPLAIEIDANANAWHSGRVNDVLALDSSTLVVGTDTGGVWLVSTTAIPLSNNWDNPDIKCLAFGPDGPEHLYAGCAGNGALFETDTGDFHPVSNWRQRAKPQETGAIYRIGILKASRRIVLACHNGVWWSNIPRAPTRNGNYGWRQAQGLPAGIYSGLAVGPNDTIAVAAAQGGIFYGDWSTGNLVMRRAEVITGSKDVTGNPVSTTKMYWTSMASCDSDRRIMYAISAGLYPNGSGGPDDDFVYAVLRSEDGGKRWSSTGTTVEGAPKGHQFKFLPGNQANGWNNTIAVSPINPDVVAFGLRKGPFVSTTRGNTWRAAGMFWPNPTSNPDTLDFSTPHQHADLHVVYFDPTDSQGRRLYIGSDGGLAMTPDLGTTLSSSFNRQILSLQFYPGAFATSNLVAGLVGGGTQDNGNLYCVIEPGSSPWKELDIGNDGGIMRLLDSGQLLRYSNTNPVLRAAGRDNNQRRFISEFEVPVRVKGPSGLDKLDKPVVEIVNAPVFRNVRNHLMYAVAGRNAEVYGLFAFGGGVDLHWEFLGLVPVSDKQYINAVGSSDGLTIFVGTSEGRTFAFDTRSRSPLELSIPIKTATTGSIGRIVVQSTARVYAIFNLGSFGFILRLDGFHWNAVAFVEQIFYGLEMDRTTKTLFAATDSRVYVSRDNGDTWQRASQGLPRRPHCTDLRFVVESDGARYLYLSTYGRSVWRARLQ